MKHMMGITTLLNRCAQYAVFSLACCLVATPFTSICGYAAPRPSTQSIDQAAFDQAAFEKELEQALSSLSPEELEEVLLSGMSEKERQDYFVAKKNLEKMDIADVERFVNGQMSEGEMDQFIKRATEGIEAPSATPETAQETAPAQEKPLQDEEPKVSDEQATLIKLIDDIIKRADAFLVKAQSIPDLHIKVQKWARKKRLLEWVPGTEWQEFKAQLDSLLQKIRKLKDQDLAPKKKYRYLNDLATDTALKNNLEQLRSALNTYEPLIQEPAFGFDKLSSESRAALTRMIDKWAEAIYKLNMSDALTAIFAKYDPIAQKEREQEEQLRKKAEEQSGKPRRPGTSTIAGSLDTGYGFGDYIASSPSYDDYRSGGSPYTTPSYTAPSSIPFSDTDLTRPSGGAASKAQSAEGTGKKEDARKDEKAATPAGTLNPAGAQTPDGRARVAHPQDQQMEQDAKRLINRISGQFTDAADKMIASGLLEIRTHLTDSDAASKDLQDRMTDIEGLLGSRKGVLDTINTLKAKLDRASIAQKDAYRRELEAAFAQQASTFKKFSEQVSVISRTWDDIKSSVSDEKKQLYMGESILPAAPQPRTAADQEGAQAQGEQQPIVQAPAAESKKYVSIYDINNRLEEVKRAIRDFVR